MIGLSPLQIQRRFTAAARAAGIEARLTAHSGRVGLASELTARGASTTEVMLAGNWRTARMVAHYSAGATARTRRSRQVSVKTRVSNFVRAGNGGERHTSIPHQNHVTQELTPRAHEKITAAFDSIAPRPKPGHSGRACRAEGNLSAIPVALSRSREVRSHPQGRSAA